MPVDTIVVTTPASDGAAPAAPAADPNRPTWLPEKFKTAEEMAASYTELEKKLGTGAPAPDLSTTEAATAALKTAGLDFSKLSEEYLGSKDGKLSAATMDSLKAKGFTEAQVNQFIDGQKAVAERNTKDVHDSVGGAERFNKLVEFAKTSLTPAEVEAYNKAATTGDYASLKLILAGLNTKFDAQFGKDPKLTNGAPSSNNAGDVFSNFQEYNMARRDERYSKDSNFRKSIEAKLERSTFYKK